MVNGVLNFTFAPRDFAFQQRDALTQLVDRQRVKILLAQLGGKVVLATRKVFVGLHDGER